MSRLFAMLLGGVLLLSVCNAQAADKTALIRELIAIDGAGMVADQVITRQLPVLREEFRKRHPKASGEAEQTYVEAFAAALSERKAELIDGVAGIYDRTFTEAEIAELLAFFKSPTGIKYRAAAPVLLQEARAFGRAWGEANANVLARAARQAVKDKGLSLD